MKIKILFLTFIIAQLVFCQSSNDAYKLLPKYNPPKSPNASSFERYVSVPTNYQTGQVNYSIPLTSFTLDGLTVPLNLDYNSTGLKVLDVASWIGLGWNLNVGGTITRVVKGIPDDGSLGLMNSVYGNKLDRIVHNQMNGLERWNYFKSITQQLADTEHDIFYYEILGKQGSFYINKLGKCIELQKTNNKVQFTLKSNGELDKFAIVSERGDKFYFDLKEQSAIASLGNSVTGNDDNYYNSLKGSTWYLTEILTHNGQEIYFNYNHYQYYSKEKTESQTFFSIATGVQNCSVGVGPTYRATYINTLVDVYQINQINWNEGFIRFYIGANREDIKQVDVNAAVPFLSAVALYQTPTPFSATNAKRIHYSTFEYLQNPRLMLKKVSFMNEVSMTDHNYRFNYISEAATWPSYDYTKQSYNAQDYWGYYNVAVTNYELLPYDAISDYPDIDGTQNTMYGINRTAYTNRNNRAANPAYSSYGMLQEIIYPTGGKTKFLYEGNIVKKANLSYSTSESDILANTLIQSVDNQNNPMVTIGGIRVKKIEFYSDPNAINPSTVKNIIYDQANISTKFLPSFISYLERNSDYLSGSCAICGNKYVFTLSSSSVVNNPAYIVEYSNVTEYDGSANASGQKVHQYMPTGLGPSQYWYAPYPTPFYFSWHKGEKTVSDQLPSGSSVSEKGIGNYTNDPIYTTLSEQLNNFDADFKVSVFKNDVCAAGGMYSPDFTPASDIQADSWIANVYKWQTTVLPTENYVVSQTQEKVYTPNGTSVQKAINYNFNLNQKNRLLPNSTSTTNSKGEQIKTLIAYPQDYFSGTVSTTSDAVVNGLVNLINKNLLSLPVEEIRTISKNGIDYVVGANLSMFFPDRLALSKTYTLCLISPVPLSGFTKSYIDNNGAFIYDSRYQVEKQFYSYNSYNQPLEFTESQSTVRRSLVWDYNSSYQIAEVVNATQAEIAYTSFEAEGKGNWNFSGAPVSDGTAPTGDKVYRLSGGDITKALNSGHFYYVSCWSKEGPVTIKTNSGTSVSVNNSFKSNDWTYYEYKLPSGTTLITINRGTASEITIDELRLYPFSAQMATYTYAPLVGITSQCDVNNRITYYKYDGLNRLTMILDQNKNVLKKYCYNHFGQLGICN